MTRSILSVNNLSKNFADFRAVDGVTLKVDQSEIYGFLGPNGAGKTTTIKMLTGLLLPSQGTITISGHNFLEQPEICKSLTGYIPDRPFLYEKLTGNEYLQFIQSLYPKSGDVGSLAVAEYYLELFDLIDWRHHLIEGYSHGMRQKLIMSSIFMLNQPLIVVDEPMVGLDPKSARIVKELFRKKAADGTAIFLSTHSMEIAEELCDRIGILVNGTIRETGTMEQLREKGRSGSTHLEDIFLELTGAFELQEVIRALQRPDQTSRTGGAD